MPGPNTKVIENIPTNAADLSNLISKVLLADVESIHLSIKDGKMVVSWNQYLDEPLLPEGDETPSPPPISRIMRVMDIKETVPPRDYAFRNYPIQSISYAMHLMGLERMFCIGWVCNDPEELRDWLGLPKLSPMTQLLGIPVYVDENADREVLYLLGSRQFGGSIRSVHSVRAVRMLTEEEKGGQDEYWRTIVERLRSKKGIRKQISEGS